MDEDQLQQAASEPNALDMDDFDAGFNDGMEPEADGAEPEHASPEQASPEQASPEHVEPEQAPVGLPQTYQPPAMEQAQPAVQAVPAVPAATVAPVAPVAPVEIDETIADEFAELVRLSPQAAALAREDSPEGAAIRDRLARVGADSAFDRAEVLLERRERAAQAVNAQHQAIEAHNRSFQSVISAEHPDLFAPDRTPEQNQRLMSDMREWIESKPYVEARGLMEIYEGGRDPRQVAALLTRFKQEVGTTGTAGASKKPVVDPTAMMAVAGRGAPIVPKGIGGKDDFETGWNL